MEQTTPLQAAPASDPNTIARMAIQRSKLRSAVGNLTTERDALKAEAERLRAENVELQGKADTSASAKRVQELEAKLRQIDHRKVFDRLAAAKGARPDGLEDLYALSGYRAEGDAADEAAIGALIDEQKGKRGYLFGKAEEAPAEGTPPPARKALGSGQGSDKAGAEGTIKMAPDDPRWSDTKWIMSNYEAVAKASADRVARGEV